MLKDHNCQGEYDPLADVLSHELESGRERRKAQDWAAEAQKSAEAAAAGAASTAADAAAARQAAQQAGDFARSVRADYDYIESARAEVGKNAGNAGQAAAAAAASERNAEDWSKAARSWAVGEGMGEARPDEATDNARYYAKQAQESRADAAASCDAAAKSAAAAAGSEAAAGASAAAAAQDRTAAAAAAAAADKSESAAEQSETAAAKSAERAARQANAAMSYAIGQGMGEERPDEETENAEYYYQQAKRISEGLQGALLPMGNITFGELHTAQTVAGYMYNVIDAFTTDATFKEGAGHDYAAGTNVYWTVDGYWDALPGYQVTGVKGHAESVYRLGQVDITPANIGLGNVNNTADSEKKVASAGKVEHALTFTGGATGAYDGSADKSVKIPSTAADVGALALSGGTVTGTLILSRATDADGTKDNRPALIVGSQPTGAHLEIDANEIMAKGTGTTTTDLYINNEGGPVHIGPGGIDVSVLGAATIKAVFLAAHPVGSYYWSSNATSPQTLFGGTWTQIKDRFVLAAGDTYKTVGQTGGAASVTSGASSAANTGAHKLTTAEMPSHAHQMTINITSTATSHAATPGSNLYIIGDGQAGGGTSNDGTTNYSLQKNTASTGSNGTHSHTMAHTHSVSTLPPYIVAYCWRRTA